LIEDVFDGYDGRHMPRNQFTDAFKNLVEPGREVVARTRADHAAFDEGERARRRTAHDAIAGDGRSGIDPETEHAER
jgi:hypothetical protein